MQSILREVANVLNDVIHSEIRRLNKCDIDLTTFNLLKVLTHSYEILYVHVQGQCMYKVSACTRSVHVQGQCMYKVSACTRSVREHLGRPNSDSTFETLRDSSLFVKCYLPLIFPVPQICFMIAKFRLLVLVVIQHSSFIFLLATFIAVPYPHRAV